MFLPEYSLQKVLALYLHCICIVFLLYCVCLLRRALFLLQSFCVCARPLHFVSVLAYCVKLNLY